MYIDYRTMARDMEYSGDLFTLGDRLRAGTCVLESLGRAVGTGATRCLDFCAPVLPATRARRPKG